MTSHTILLLHDFLLLNRRLFLVALRHFRVRSTYGQVPDRERLNCCSCWWPPPLGWWPWWRSSGPVVVAESFFRSHHTMFFFVGWWLINWECLISTRRTTKEINKHNPNEIQSTCGRERERGDTKRRWWRERESLASQSNDTSEALLNPHPEGTVLFETSFKQQTTTETRWDETMTTEPKQSLTHFNARPFPSPSLSLSFCYRTLRVYHFFY